jgi:tRNA pseudouridine38/39 synthase
MAAVLFMVGRGDETPEIIPALLDVETNPRKPQYAMADDLPLVLYDCKFPGLVWRYGAVSLGRIATILHSHFRQAALTGAVVKVR